MLTSEADEMPQSFEAPTATAIEAQRQKQIAAIENIRRLLLRAVAEGRRPKGRRLVAP